MSCSHPDVGRYEKESEPMHCGSCIPCIIRRAAIFRGLGVDETKFRDNKLNKTETAKLNKSAFLQKLRRFNKNSAILEIQKSGTIEENLEEISEMYCRGMVEIEKFFKEVIR